MLQSFTYFWAQTKMIFTSQNLILYCIVLTVLPEPMRLFSTIAHKQFVSDLLHLLSITSFDKQPTTNNRAMQKKGWSPIQISHVWYAFMLAFFTIKTIMCSVLFISFGSCGPVQFFSRAHLPYNYLMFNTIGNWNMCPSPACIVNRLQNSLM